MKNLSDLDSDIPKLLILCGKGGVGKTTCASAAAIHFAKKGLKTLLVSSDPTPSLSDILEKNVRGNITQIPGVQNLHAVELTRELILQKWRKKFGQRVYEVISSFLPVEKDIIDYVAGAPGIDEEFAVSYILDYFNGGDYDIIVWDTEPAGGMLALMKLQDKFYAHLGDAAKLYIKVKKALDILTEGKKKRDPLTMITEWRELIKNILNMISSPKTQTIIITIPEALGVRQTERILKDLKTFKTHIFRIIINYVITKNTCNCNFHKQRAQMQNHYIRILTKKYGEKPGLAVLPQLPQEVKGIKAIETVENLLF